MCLLWLVPFPYHILVTFVKVWTVKVFVFFLIFSSANKCLLKVATYAAQLEQYQKAIEIFEQVWQCYPAKIWSLVLDMAPIHLWRLLIQQCRPVISGWNLRNGQHASQIQCQGLLLQGSPLSLLHRHAQCKSKRGCKLYLCSEKPRV